MPLFILITALLLCSGCRWSPDLLAGRINLASRFTTQPYYVEDMQGNVIPNFQVNKASYNVDMFVKAGNGRMMYTDNTVMTYTGIDVSSHQGDIDWQAVRNDGITFAFIRAAYRGYGTDGKICEDVNFRTNVQQAINAGLKVGVYFFSQAINEQEALEEAEFILSLVQGYNLSYPIVFDWERYSNPDSRTYNTDSETITACAKAFCDRIALSGYRPMIYLNCEFGYYEYDLEVLSDYDCWLAQYNEKPTYYYHYTIWQYTKSGTVAGVSGTVDMNICLYDYSSESLG